MSLPKFVEVPLADWQKTQSELKAFRSMLSADDLKAKITEVENAYSHVLSGEVSTITINAPRALMQLEAETKLKTLHWVLGTTYKSKLKGVDAGGFFSKSR